MNDELLSVGHFAKLAALSVHALRHYDAIGLLAPAHVDAQTGYHRYAPDQIVTARLIADLRWLSVPVAVVRTIIADPQSEQARSLLAAHADHLVRQRHHLDRQINQCTSYATQGVPMPTTVATVTPVQIKVGVSDKFRARRFYTEAFGLAERVIRHTEDEDVPGYQFGEYGQPGFFFVFFVDDGDFDRPGRSTFGLLVPDLDAAHQRAVAAGAAEAVAPTSAEGMPRASAVTDVDGNWIWLYQG